MKFSQHIPTFVETMGEPSPCFEFNSLQELLDHPIVARYKEHCDGVFSHFALSDNHLMVISNDGFNWWVVGYVSDPDALDLPKWEGWKYDAELADGSRAVLNGNQIVSSCGDKLKLHDGSFARNVRY